MIRFSDDPNRAEQEMHAVIFYLTTFGYIDGDFDAQEKSFVRDYIAKLIDQRARHAMPGAEESVRREVADKYTRHFHEVFEGIDQNVKDLFTESVTANEDPTQFVHSRLKVRCFEIFQQFDRATQEQLMATIDELLMADGVAHPAEVQFRAELAALLEEDFGVELLDDDSSQSRVKVADPMRRQVSYSDHPFFKPYEQHYAKDPGRIRTQLDADLDLVDRAMRTLEAQRKAGEGKLTGKKTLAELAGAGPFLDGHVFARMPAPGESYDITVLGDLHGCYSVLKATLMQSRFFAKVDSWRNDPKSHPFPLLVLLGDYVDRGLFSLNGVLRTVLSLYVTAPDHVWPLRGNHEYYIEHQGNMYGGVKPAESINSLKPHVSIDVLRRYRDLFEALPNVGLFDTLFFVHGGIAKDRLLKERFKDLSSLNDPDIRFQMMWSDPSTADVIPADLQDKSARFAFGRMQFKAFLQRIGATTMIRGHEKVVAGFAKTYDEENAKLMTLFSSGGKDNADLPSTSTYREVTPMALSITWKDGETEVTPWAPEYASYNDPARNDFFKVPPEIEHRA
jgi:hypothetical protein